MEYTLLFPNLIFVRPCTTRKHQNIETLFKLFLKLAIQLLVIIQISISISLTQIEMVYLCINKRLQQILSCIMYNFLHFLFFFLIN